MAKNGEKLRKKNAIELSYKLEDAAAYCSIWACFIKLHWTTECYNPYIIALHRVLSHPFIFRNALNTVPPLHFQNLLSHPFISFQPFSVAYSVSHPFILYILGPFKGTMNNESCTFLSVYLKETVENFLLGWLVLAKIRTSNIKLSYILWYYNLYTKRPHVFTTDKKHKLLWTLTNGLTISV